MPATLDSIELLTLAAVAAGGDEGDVVLAEVLADQAAGVAGGAVDDDGLVGHGHIPIPPSTGRPTPLTKRDASEARKTTASAMSDDLAEAARAG